MQHIIILYYIILLLFFYLSLSFNSLFSLLYLCTSPRTHDFYYLICILLFLFLFLFFNFLILEAKKLLTMVYFLTNKQSQSQSAKKQ